MANTLFGVAAVITSLATLIATVAALRRIDTMGKVVDKVNVEVTAINGKTIAQLADAGETRRIEEVPVAERTDAEAEHVAVVPPEA